MMNIWIWSVILLLSLIQGLWISNFAVAAKRSDVSLNSTVIFSVLFSSKSLIVS